MIARRLPPLECQQIALFLLLLTFPVWGTIMQVVEAG